MFEAVTCAIPGARSEAQARNNARAASLPKLSPSAMAAVQSIYDEEIRRHVHSSW
jgi:aryl-alcohol dehydrogenase-like predicted oxidoreductase